MNQLANNNLTMSSFDLWNKLNEFRSEDGANKIQHGDFLSRVEDEIDDLGVSDFFPHPQNKQQVRFYTLNKDQMLLVGMRESKVVRKKVLEWLKELTNKQPALPQSFAEALQLAADQAKQLELAAPKVAFVDKYVEAQTGNKTFRQVCKLLQVKENAFRAFLTKEKIMYRLGGEWAAYAQHIDAGRFATKTGVSDYGHAYNAANFTPKGIEWIAAKWAVYKLKGE